MERTRNHLAGTLLLLLPLLLAFGCRSTPGPELGDYDASMTLRTLRGTGQQTDQYLANILVWRQRADGSKALVSAPQLTAIAGLEAVYRVGSVAGNGTHCRLMVSERSGKMVGTASIECFENGALVWQRTLETEAVAVGAAPAR